MLSIARSAAKLLVLALSIVLLSGCGNGSGLTAGEDSTGLGRPADPDPGESGSAPSVTATATPPPSTQEPREPEPSCDPSYTPTPCDDPPATAPTAPPVEEPRPTDPVTFSGCESVQGESHYCLTTAGGEIRLLGLDSGRSCPIATTDAPTGIFLFSGSIAWLDKHVYVCGESGLIRISLNDGSWEIAGAPCNGVASYDGGLLVNRWFTGLLDSEGGPWFGPPLSWYPDYEAVRSDEPERTFDLGGFAATMTVQGSTLYTAWHAGVSIDVGDLTEDRSLGVLTLEDYDGWMLGMSVTQDGYLVLISYEGVLVFDAYDGRRVDRLDASVTGLACVAGDAVAPRDTPSVTPTPTPHDGGKPTATPCASFNCPDPCADLASDPSPFRLHELPPSAPVESCLGGYGSSNYVLPDELLVPGATAEMHVVGVYEGRGHAGFRPYSQGVVDVVVHARPKPVVLALSSYEGMFWRITVDPGATLSRVIVQGYGPQEVEGVPEGVPVAYREPYEACGYAYGWEVWNNGGGYEPTMKSLRRFTGLIETSFQGCYTGAAFEIPHWSGEPPWQPPTPVAGDETVAREDVPFAGCAGVTAETQYCLTTTYGGIALLGLDSGQVCPLAETSAGVGDPLVSSIAWRGELMYACTGAGLVRASLRDGSWEAAQLACDGVAAYDGGLLLSSSLADPTGWLEPLRAYPDYVSILDGVFSHAFTVGGGATRFTVAGDVFYGAWHSTNMIDVADLSADAPRDSIVLDGYDGWILGMSVVDGQLVISGDTWGDTVRVFDVQTGAHLRDVHPSTPVFGLSCVSRSVPS
jgi:hypothetical protein